MLLLREAICFPRREVLEQAETLAPMSRTVARAIIIDDVSRGLEAWPVDVVNAVDEDEEQGNERKREPQQEIVE